jgi:hypothetical protein
MRGNTGFLLRAATTNTLKMIVEAYGKEEREHN